MTDRSPGANQAVAPPYDALGEAKRILRSIRIGALATLAVPSGHPFATLVNVATDTDGRPILLTSQLSAHSRHLKADARCSILLAEVGRGDPLAHPRLTLAGTAVPSDDPRLRARFLRRHPKASLYASFRDFGFSRLDIGAVHFNGGFGRAGGFEPSVILTDIGGAQPLIAGEEEILARLNEEGSEILQACAGHRGGGAKRRWLATGVDPEGIDLIRGDQTARISFKQRVTTPQALHEALGALARAGDRPTGYR
ncbi:MAG: pyridoxamine 5'-phosphate oxidase family protein [Methylobacteriaceae bacterium]|nr:pyridoxamine 5'-phosphate oxidase family protein [Methylobacteriaceae bacterium]MBV9246653.1 pyridoxamine 5'-phosphate oxidase family protein [Methylobacteriaceae bacterium]